eukprot:620493-Pelagomonas_calceolata.AAC.1
MQTSANPLVQKLTLHTILLGVSGTCCIEHTLISSNNLDLTIDVPLNLLACFMPILLCTPSSLLPPGVLLNNHPSHSQTLEPGASTDPPDPH